VAAKIHESLVVFRSELFEKFKDLARAKQVQQYFSSRGSIGKDMRSSLLIAKQVINDMPIDC
jgi:hypothetical protein